MVIQGEKSVTSHDLSRELGVEGTEMEGYKVCGWRK